MELATGREMLGNLLLVMGAAFLIGGWGRERNKFVAEAKRVVACDITDDWLPTVPAHFASECPQHAHGDAPCTMSTSVRPGPHGDKPFTLSAHVRGAVCENGALVNQGGGSRVRAGSRDLLAALAVQDPSTSQRGLRWLRGSGR